MIEWVINMKQVKLIMLGLLAGLLIACGADKQETPPKEQLEEESNEEAAEEMKKELEGYVLQIEANRFLFLETDSEDLYEEVKDLSMEKLLQKETLPLIYVNYAELDQLEKGDHIEVKFDGIMTFSIPGQINAQSVELIE